MALLTLAEAKLQLNIASTDISADVEIQSYVDAAAGVVENHTGEAVSEREFVQQFSVSSSRTLVVSWVPVVSVTSVTSLDGARVWDPADIRITTAGVLRTINAPAFDGHLEVTYRAGYTVAPPNYNLAGRVIVQHLWQTQRGVTGPRVGGMEDSGNVMGGGRGYAIPNAALELLGERGPVFA